MLITAKALQLFLRGTYHNWQEGIWCAILNSYSLMWAVSVANLSTIMQIIRRGALY